METVSKETTLWKKLLETTEKIRNYQSRAISKGKALDISMTQMQIMGCVLFSPEKSVRVRDISEELGITPGGISQQVDTLVKMGLLERKPDEKDRRAVCITLSEKGEEINQWVDQFLTNLFQKLLADVPEEKRWVFAEVLDSMYQTLEKL
ncbi:MAG: MarR family transcriptional regulator [Lentisphaeria bacterium]|nr:MarR family transcriptional regulator [Lentisphaeria bacterium]